jgi:hypothetical protein
MYLTLGPAALDDPVVPCSIGRSELLALGFT